MTRKLFNLASLIWLVLFLAAATLWLRSFRAIEQIEFRHHGELRRVWVQSGKVGIDNEPQVLAETEKEKRAREAVAAIPGIGFLAIVPRANVVIDPPSRIPPRWSHSSAIPLPLATFLFAVASTRGIVGWAIRRRRRAGGLCLCCGYNLRGNISGICPECGTPMR